jgi:uracil permease
MKLVYDVEDRPRFSQTLVFAFQQMIAIMAATILVPMIISSVGLSMDPSAALFGAGAGSLFYIFTTKKGSPVFLGSSFTFIGAMSAAVAMNYGYWGLIIGCVFAALVYVIVAIIVKATGSGWVNKLLPPVIIGPIVALIGLSLSSTATNWVQTNGAEYNWIAILLGLFTFFLIVFVSIKGKKMMKLIPFIIGIAGGYVLALILTLIGKATGMAALQVMNFTPFEQLVTPFKFSSILSVPRFTFLEAIRTNGQYPIDGAAIANIALIYAPIGVVELSQHISDHKNLGYIIGRDLIKDPGLHRTLVGDGVGSAIGAFFGGCANTTYGESIGCVALTGNASIVSIIWAAIGCMVLSFFSPFVAWIETIPFCIMGGACIALYGFIAVSGLNMLHQVNLGDNRNLYVVSSILVCGIGGLMFKFGHNAVTGGALLEITALAAALIVGLITRLIVNLDKSPEIANDIPASAEQAEAAKK